MKKPQDESQNVVAETKATSEISVKENGAWSEPQENEQVLGVEVFKTTPAVVSFKMGRTVNLGDFNSVRIDVGISIPCYREQVDQAYVQANLWTDERLKLAIEEFAAEWKAKIDKIKKKNAEF